MISQSVYFDYLSSLMEGDKAACTRIVSDLIEKNVDVKEIYTDLIQKAMYRIGHLWEHNRSSIATEHIATKITESLLALMYPKIYTTEKIGKKAIVTCVDKEFHEIGPKIVSDFFELHGWESTFLGANTPRSEVINIIREKQPDVVGISNNFYINFVRLLKMVEEIKTIYPDQDIIVGGQAINEDIDSALHNYENVVFVKDLNMLEEYITEKSK